MEHTYFSWKTFWMFIVLNQIKIIKTCCKISNNDIKINIRIVEIIFWQRGYSLGNSGLAPGVSLSDRHERYIRVHYYYYYYWLVYGMNMVLNWIHICHKLTVHCLQYHYHPFWQSHPKVVHLNFGAYSFNCHENLFGCSWWSDENYQNWLQNLK